MNNGLFHDKLINVYILYNPEQETSLCNKVRNFYNSNFSETN